MPPVPEQKSVDNRGVGERVQQVCQHVMTGDLLCGGAVHGELLLIAKAVSSNYDLSFGKFSSHT
jgi:hypothetical protein